MIELEHILRGYCIRDPYSAVSGLHDLIRDKVYLTVMYPKVSAISRPLKEDLRERVRLGIAIATSIN